MELPQSRPFGTEGRKATHEFLSLYTHSSVHQQDPRAPSQGNSLKTHDFLQPLERVGRGNGNEEAAGGDAIASVGRGPAVEHILPGGIGTYSISHVPYLGQRPKPEGAFFPIAQGSSSEKNEENSNCSSYTGSGFSLWEEPAAKKGKTDKEHAHSVGERSSAREPVAAKLGHWTPERSSLSSSNNYNHNSLTSLSSSQPSAQKSQSFIEMIKSAKGSTSDKDTDDGEEFAPKKESPTTITPIKGELRVKVGGKNHEQKANTPRSKHSATEQRRRSKINDRFQKLRELIPHSDQKRDKASFLLEVIEYIQFLQEKVYKYEGSYQGWNHEAAAKMMPWRNNQRSPEKSAEQSRGIICGSSPALIVATNVDEKNVSVPSIVPGSANPVGSAISSASTLKSVDRPSGVINKAVPFPMPLQPHIINPVANGAIAELPFRVPSDATDDTASQPHAQSRSSIIETSDASHKLKSQELAIEGGTINISSVYSQGLLNTLTKALQSSGVDLSQASISVQIQLGQRTNGRLSTPLSGIRDNEIPSGNQGKVHLRDASCEEPDKVMKKLKTCRN